jgi:2-iminobutanoate/2-iminopropanoate deaminase
MISGADHVAKQPVAGSRPAGAYSPGIIAEGRFLYVSGQAPLRDGKVVGETTGEQTRIALENLAAVLAAAGAGPDDVVRCGVFLADMADFAEMNSAYGEFFADPLPARTTVGAALAGFKVEIDCVAVLPAASAAEGT